MTNFVLAAAGRSLVYILQEVYCARPQLPFPALEILLECAEEDQRIMGFVLSYSPL